MPTPHALVLDGHGLSMDVLAAFLATPSHVSAHPQALARVRESAALCDRLAAGEEPHYGINTGFGAFKNKRIEPDKVRDLQLNLIRSHATALGPLLDADIVRLMLLLRANSLLIGYSGVSETLVLRLIDMVNRDILPVIPCYGSVGASGDLAPLAHMSLALVGEGEVVHRGKRCTAAEALAAEKLNPLVLGAKEGLALINGTQFMSAFAVRETLRARRLLATSMATASMSLEARQATDRVFDARLHALKPHPGQVRVAEAFRRLHADSAIMRAHRDCDRVQDPYSFRCIPQVLGAVADTLEWIETWVVREVNSVTDNPILFSEQGDALSGGNFHGEHMAIALDALAVAGAEVASIAERRIDQLMAGDGEKVPRCLTPDPGLNSGFMIAQYLAAALVSENKVHAHPASVDTIPTSLGFEDHVSMGSIGAIKASRVLDNVARVVAVEALCGAQALDFHRPLTAGKGALATARAVRAVVPFLERDAVLSGHLAALEARVNDGSLLAAVEAEVGPLLPRA